MAEHDCLLERFVDEDRPDFSKPFVVGDWVIATCGSVILAVKSRTNLSLLPCPTSVRHLFGKMVLREPESTIPLRSLLEWCMEMLLNHEFGVAFDVPFDLRLLLELLQNVPWETTYLERATMTDKPALFLGGSDWRVLLAGMSLESVEGRPVFTTGSA